LVDHERPRRVLHLKQFGEAAALVGHHGEAELVFAGDRQRLLAFDAAQHPEHDHAALFGVELLSRAERANARWTIWRREDQDHGMAVERPGLERAAVEALRLERRHD